MESLREEMSQLRLINEEKFIKKLAKCLDDGGNIDFQFQDYCGGKIYILHDSIKFERKRVVKYALSRGADIAIKTTGMSGAFRYQNALELAAATYHFSKQNLRSSIFVLLKKRSLEVYASYGLTALHIECAVGMENWSDEAKNYLQTGDVNATISAESPLWPKMTPLLIAAKFLNKDLMSRLLDLGANPIARDSEGNTPLHYLYYTTKFFDERLFAFDGRDTFGSIIGESHFHIACRNCPRALNIVKRYLDQGISPNLPIKKCIKSTSDTNMYEGYYAGKVGLHLSADETNLDVCPELVQLLLEHGADLKKKDSCGATPVDHFRKWLGHKRRWVYCDEKGVENYIECIFLFIDAGSNADKLISDTDQLYEMLGIFYENYGVFDIYRLLLEGIKKLIVLTEGLISEKWKDLYCQIVEKYEWNEADYAARCSDELEALTRLALRPILEGTIVINSDFRKRFRFVVDSLDHEAYSIYGKSLRVKAKRMLVEHEKKKRKMGQTVPKLQWLFQKHGRLPHLCAENILWNMTDEELTQFNNITISQLS